MKDVQARLLRGLSLALCLSLGAPTVAFAADEATKARAAFNDGVQLEAAGNFALALTKFQEVANFKRTPSVLFHIAFCQEKLGHLVEALGGYKLAAHEAESDPKTHAEALEKATDAIGALEKRIPKVVIKRGRGAESAKITLDGVDLGRDTDKPFSVDPGSHAVDATERGKEPFSKIVKLAEGETKTVEVTLKASSSEGKPDEDPKAGKPDEGGKKDDGVKVSTEDKSIVPYLVLGAGVAAFGFGAYQGLRRNSLKNDLDAACGDRPRCPASAKSIQDEGKSAATLATVGLGLGIIGIGVGTYLVVTQGSDAPKKEARPAKPRVDLQINVGSTYGANLVGTF